MKNSILVLMLVGATAAPSRLLANDGGIAFGGSPALLRQHPTVTMESEVVRVEIGPKLVTVDCRFVFRNRGPSCTVRMGFPDEGGGEYDPQQNTDAHGRPLPPRSTFRSFRSYVDNAPVRTSLIRSNDPSRFWHAKVVAFGASATRVVRDVYTADVGTQLAREGAAHQVRYTLHTGASWHGLIGRSEVTVAFHTRLPAIPMRLRRVPRARAADQMFDRSWTGDRHSVFYTGPCRAAVRKRTLTFIRTRWRPAVSDDVWVVFPAEG
jgi:hypothetical protein